MFLQVKDKENQWKSVSAALDKREEAEKAVEQIIKAAK